jgi:hypothetical protein
MLLYTKHNSPRLSYIAGFIGGELFNDGLTVTDDADYFNSWHQPKLNYSANALSPAEFYIRPVSLLFETSIRIQEIECSQIDFKPAFFLTRGDFSFDIFAAAFYLLSRYEEYLPAETDQYGRFSHQSSLAFRENFLDIPLINYWLQDFKKSLLTRFPGMVFRKPDFKFIPTYDIDIAYSYRFKGFFRNAGGLFRSLFKGQWSLLADRVMVLSKQKKDPYDSYEWLDALHLYCRTRAYYFFLVAGKQRSFDRNINPSKKAMQHLIEYHSKGYTVGIHPSWQSGDDEDLLQQEVECLEAITQSRVLYSRQHYIRMQLPHTYRRLIQAGIEKEFSMGYGTVNGFRASVASSFYWYDLEAETQTKLMIFPFCFMDATAFYQNQLSPSKAFSELMHYYHIVKKVNGLMVTLWHNEFFGTDPQFRGWREVYEIFLKEEVYWDM